MGIKKGETAILRKICFIWFWLIATGLMPFEGAILTECIKLFYLAHFRGSDLLLVYIHWWHVFDWSIPCIRLIPLMTCVRTCFPWCTVLAEWTDAFLYIAGASLAKILPALFDAISTFARVSREGQRWWWRRDTFDGFPRYECWHFFFSRKNKYKMNTQNKQSYRGFVYLGSEAFLVSCFSIPSAWTLHSNAFVPRVS